MKQSQIMLQKKVLAYGILISEKRIYTCSVMSDSVTHGLNVAHQAPLSMVFSRREYWNRLPLPTPGDLPGSGIELASLASRALTGCLYHCTTKKASGESLKHVSHAAPFYICADSW